MSRAVRAFSKSASQLVTSVLVPEVSTGRSMTVSVIESLQVAGFGGSVVSWSAPSISLTGYRAQPYLTRRYVVRVHRGPPRPVRNPRAPALAALRPSNFPLRLARADFRMTIRWG